MGSRRARESGSRPGKPWRATPSARRATWPAFWFQEEGTMDLLTPQAAAARLFVKPTTLERWRRAGRGPRCVRIGRRVIRYRVTDVDRWVTQHLTPKRAAS